MSWPVKQPPRKSIDPKDTETLKTYDAVVERAQKMGFVDDKNDGGYYGRLLWSPTLSHMLSEFGRTVRTLGDRGDSYTHADREFVDQVLAVDFRTNIVQERHLPDALSTGVRLEAIEALRENRLDLLTNEELELTNFIRRVVGGTMNSETWDTIELRMGKRGAVDYTIFILFLQLTMRLHQAVGIPEFPEPELVKMIADIKAGARKIPDYRRGIN
jgi:hypothetical protein